MKNILFVAGIDFALTETQLKDVFASHGTVNSAKIITDRMSGNSRGFGFIEMSSQAEAEECIRKLDNSTLSGRQIGVRFKEDKPASRNNNSRGGYSKRW